MGWISTEQPPENNRDVLATDGKVMAVASFDCLRWNPVNVKEVHGMSGVDFDMNQITHWKELGDLPENNNQQP